MRQGLMGRVWCATLMGSLFALVGGVDAQPLTNFVKEDELRGAVEKWRIAREVYYSTLYDRSLKILVAKDASDFVVRRYVEQKPLPTSVSEMGVDVVRVAVRMDLERVLNRSFFDEVTERYGSFGLFLVGLTTGKVGEVPIDKKRMEETLEREKCGVIPCDPTKCNPDTCATESVRRSMPKTK